MKHFKQYNLLIEQKIFKLRYSNLMQLKIKLKNIKIIYQKNRKIKMI